MRVLSVDTPSPFHEQCVGRDTTDQDGEEIMRGFDFISAGLPGADDGHTDANGVMAVQRGRRFTGRRCFATAAAAVAVTAAVSLGLNGLASASVARTNNPGPVARTQAETPAATAGTLAGAAVKKLKLEYYSVDAAGFAPDGLHNAAVDYFNQWDFATLSNQDAGRCFNAAVHLPNGVKMVSATFYYTAGTTAMFGELNEQDFSTQKATELVSFDSAPVTTPTYTNTVETIAAADQLVNTQNAYSLGVCPVGDTTFSGVTIAYTG